MEEGGLTAEEVLAKLRERHYPLAKNCPCCIGCGCGNPIYSECPDARILNGENA